MEVEISLTRTAKSKLTVTAGGAVRIKFSSDLSIDECAHEQERLLQVAKQVIAANFGKTMRGRVEHNGIRMWNDARSEGDIYFWKDLT